MLSNHGSQKHSNNRGYSLLEMILTVVVVGILAAIAIPSFIGWFDRHRVNEGSAQVKGAIKEAQRQAIRRGRRCKIRIDTTKITVSAPESSVNYNDCLLNERTLPTGVAIKTNYTTPVITFSPRGNTNSAGTIVVYSADGAQTKKCIVISLGLGIMRSGDYTGNVSTSISATQCKTTD
jgi:prepilin-type N-terminal cleavage/methylation domain-containing protein